MGRFFESMMGDMRQLPIDVAVSRKLGGLNSETVRSEELLSRRNVLRVELRVWVFASAQLQMLAGFLRN